MNTAAVHPGGLNAAQSLAFFKANGIQGEIIKNTRLTQLREFTHLAMHLDGKVYLTTSRIRAIPSHFA